MAILAHLSLTQKPTPTSLPQCGLPVNQTYGNANNKKGVTMRVVTRVYRDSQTKPHYDEYKTDCDDDETLDQALQDIGAFIVRVHEELEDDDDVS